MMEIRWEKCSVFGRWQKFLSVFVTESLFRHFRYDELELLWKAWKVWSEKLRNLNNLIKLRQQAGEHRGKLWKLPFQRELSSRRFKVVWWLIAKSKTSNDFEPSTFYQYTSTWLLDLCLCLPGSDRTAAILSVRIVSNPSGVGITTGNKTVRCLRQIPRESVRKTQAKQRKMVFHMSSHTSRGAFQFCLINKILLIFIPPSGSPNPRLDGRCEERRFYKKRK